jgi:hypothetical protein
MILIDCREAYDYVKSRGYEPLADDRFQVEFELRLELQERFKSDDQFYRWFWDVRPHYCEETGTPLRHYSAVHVSHILTRGAHPEMRYDGRNVNLLTFRMHNLWERGTEEQKMRMNIYSKNQRRIEQLLKDYQ